MRPRRSHELAVGQGVGDQMRKAAKPGAPGRQQPARGWHQQRWSSSPQPDLRF